ncbi:hypothetical protein GcM3_070030 [Golovinomyces cichoracearum]|uniref:Uncharacterized protein n=1 Tax=Golovinomyces cichoracearum TaxID=62708 RepID=A0A420ISS5_9PEZI|nr:hypothetical protein GcM3_070030 [Golovinomyces cichoracearum]
MPQGYDDSVDMTLPQTSGLRCDSDSHVSSTHHYLQFLGKSPDDATTRIKSPSRLSVKPCFPETSQLPWKNPPLSEKAGAMRFEEKLQINPTVKIRVSVKDARKPGVNDPDQHSKAL